MIMDSSELAPKTPIQPTSSTAHREAQTAKKTEEMDAAITERDRHTPQASADPTSHGASHLNRRPRVALGATLKDKNCSCILLVEPSY